LRLRRGFCGCREALFLGRRHGRYILCPPRCRIEVLATSSLRSDLARVAGDAQLNQEVLAAIELVLVVSETSVDESVTAVIKYPLQKLLNFGHAARNVYHDLASSHVFQSIMQGTRCLIRSIRPLHVVQKCSKRSHRFAKMASMTVRSKLLEPPLVREVKCGVSCGTLIPGAWGQKPADSG
jgi:hypothetical protein